MSELYCKLFISSDFTYPQLLAHVAAMVRGHVSGKTVTSGDFEWDVRSNDEYLSDASGKRHDDFLHFRYTVEAVSDSDKTDLPFYLKRVGEVMNGLYQAGMQVVAACDWEDLLPGRGRLMREP